MTDSSSESDSYSQRDEMAAMAGELMEAKMQTQQARNQMTHMLRMGNFHLEIVPNKDIDIEIMKKVAQENVALFAKESNIDFTHISNLDIYKSLLKKYFKH